MPGQLAPNYVYGLGIGFSANPSVRAIVGLTTSMAGKTAVFTVTPPTGPSQTVSVPFEWRMDRFYFLFVHQTATAGTWGALVFDLDTNTWTPIGALTLPTAWGKLAPSAVTAVGWSGPVATSCAAYPQANVVMRSPTGFVNGTAIDSRLTQTATTDGACPAENTIGPGGWVRYRAGAI